LESAVRFIAKDNPESAVRVGNALIDRVAILENFPLIARCIQSAPVSANWFRGLTSFSTVFERRKMPWTSCVTGTARSVNRICARRIKFAARKPCRRRELLA
jgi:hypothetical protein